MFRRHRHTVPAVIAAFALSVVATVPVAANSTAQLLPFTQDWTNTGLITVNDSWSGVPGVTGFRGQDITTGVDTDPQTLLGKSTLANDLDVIPNLVTLVTNGGVGEYHFTNPVVALQPDVGSDAPYLLFHLDATGFPEILASRMTCAISMRPATTPHSRSPSSTALARAGTSRTFLPDLSPMRRLECRNVGHPGAREAARRGRRSAACPGQDNHDECRATMNGSGSTTSS